MYFDSYSSSQFLSTGNLCTLHHAVIATIRVAFAIRLFEYLLIGFDIFSFYIKISFLHDLDFDVVGAVIATTIA